MSEYLVEYTNYRTGSVFTLTTESPAQMKEQIYQWASNDPSISAQDLSAEKPRINQEIDRAIEQGKAIESADQELLDKISKQKKVPLFVFVPPPGPGIVVVLLAVVVLVAFVAAAIYLSQPPPRPTPRPIPSLEPF